MGMRSPACVMTCLWLTKSRSGGIMGTCTCWRLMTKTMRSNVWNGKLTHLIDRRQDLGSGNELLKLLTGEITNAYGFGEPHILSLFHAFPQRLYVNRKKIFFWNWYLAHFFAQPQRPVYQKQIKVFQLKIPTLHRPQIKRFYDDQETVRTFLDFHSIPVAYMASKVGGFCICVCFGRDFTRGFSWWRARQGLSRQRCTRASKWWIARPWIWWALGAGLGQLLRQEAAPSLRPVHESSVEVAVANSNSFEHGLRRQWCSAHPNNGHGSAIGADGHLGHH